MGGMGDVRVMGSQDHMDEWRERMEAKLDRLTMALLGPEDGSRPGLLTECQVRREKGTQLEQRVATLEREHRQEAEEERRQARQRTLITTAVSGGITAGLVAAWEIFKTVTHK